MRLTLLSTVPFLLLMAGCLSHESGHGDHQDHPHNLDTVSAGRITGPVTRSSLMTRGAAIYNSICSHCHQPTGQGITDSIPPLVNSDFLMADRLLPIRYILRGLSGPIVVNGRDYDGIMPAMIGSDTSVAAVLTYVRNYFSGARDSIGVAEVEAYRRTL